MAHSKQIAHDGSNDNNAGYPPANGANEIRTLDDGEMASAGGGDNVVIWVSPPTGP